MKNYEFFENALIERTKHETIVLLDTDGNTVTDQLTANSSDIAIILYEKAILIRGRRHYRKVLDRNFVGPNRLSDCINYLIGVSRVQTIAASPWGNDLTVYVRKD